MSEIPHTYRAIEHITKDPSRLQPHPFTAQVSAGLASVLDSSASELVIECLTQRSETSEMLGREDLDAYMINLIGHLLTEHIRDGEVSIGEETLLEWLDDEKKGSPTELSKASFWQENIINMLERDKEQFWLKFRLRDTQTVVADRSRGVVAGLVALAASSDSSNVDTSNLRFLDVGGSAGFVSAALFDVEKVIVAYESGKQEEVDITVNKAVVLDNLDGETFNPGDKSWIRVCSTPLKDLYNDPDSLTNYDDQLERVHSLRESGNISFVNNFGYSDGVLALDRLPSDDFNMAILSTVLHQLTIENRAEAITDLKQLLMSGNNRSNWALLVNDFAELSPNQHDQIRFEEKRWHGTDNPAPYKTFVIPSWKQQKPHWYEVAGWKTSRCDLAEMVVTENGLLGSLGIRGLEIISRSANQKKY